MVSMCLSFLLAFMTASLLFFLLILRTPNSTHFFFLMIRRPPRSTLDRSSAASDVYKRQEHYRVDLVFYNRILKCFVLIDLKIGKLAHQDLGLSLIHISEPTRPY